VASTVNEGNTGDIMKPKYKTGQKVKCLNRPDDILPMVGKDESFGGRGWKLDRAFIIDRITHDEGDMIPIYWAEEDSGVYENFLTDTEWDDDENK